MQKVKALSLFLLTLSIISVIIGSLVKYVYKFKAERTVLEKNLTQVLLKATDKLHYLYEQGGDKNCQKKVPFDYLRCDPSFLRCLLENRLEESGTAIKINHNNKEYRVYVDALSDEVYSVIYRENAPAHFPDKGYVAKLSVKEGDAELTQRTIFENSCEDFYLPERVYAYGPQIKGKTNWLWDNFNRDIFIDKFPVSWENIRLWKKFAPDKINKDISVPKDGKELYKAATNMTVKQMKAYCASQGKRLLTAHAYDAASFLPKDVSDQTPQYHLRSPYPWTRKKRESFLYQARKGKNQNISQAQCEKAYTKECLELFPLFARSRVSLSWTGFVQTLGGELEVFDNKINPKKNLKASSHYFAAASRWHQIGERAYWDGEDFLYRNFNWRYEDPDGKGPIKDAKFPVAFRCMKDVPKEAAK